MKMFHSDKRGDIAWIWSTTTPLFACQSAGAHIFSAATKTWTPKCFLRSTQPKRLFSKGAHRARPNPSACMKYGSGDEEAHGQLPPGSSTSKEGGKADLGFVGADRIGISFVCTKDDCNTRIVKSVRRRSYETGTVVIQCQTCKNYHVVADNTGMYSSLTGGSKNIEQMAEKKGDSVTRVDKNTFQLEDIVANMQHDDTEKGQSQGLESGN